MCPDLPVQTSSYVGFSVCPPAYPEITFLTPDISSKRTSTPQKQPAPSINFEIIP